MAQWENLPEPARQPSPPVPASRAGFTADPRVEANRSVRATDADRAYAISLLRQSQAEGRLSAAETEERIAEVARTRTFGEVAPLVRDLMASDTPPPRPPASKPRSAILASWLGLALLMNAIYLMVGLTTGRLGYYWPMWPIVIVGIPAVLSYLWRPSPDDWARKQARRDSAAARRNRRELPARGQVVPPPIQDSTPHEDLR